MDELDDVLFRVLSIDLRHADFLAESLADPPNQAADGALVLSFYIDGAFQLYSPIESILCRVVCNFPLSKSIRPIYVKQTTVLARIVQELNHLCNLVVAPNQHRRVND
jgi:hypothetical protein